MSLSKSKIKYIQSLKDKKHRNQHGTFVAEGNKMVSDLLPYMSCQLLIATESFIQEINEDDVENIIIATNDDIAKASFLKNPQEVIAVFYQPKSDENIDISDQLCLALDGIQDPGNMGTIVRIADWYGIKNIFCSLDTADVYNPKVIQATMGAIARVNVHYINLEDFLKKHDEIPVYGTLLDGDNMYDKELTKNGVIIMGNEGNGIRPDIQQYINQKLYIPNYPLGTQTSESLNVAVATAIVCTEFRRRSF